MLLSEEMPYYSQKICSLYSQLQYFTTQSQNDGITSAAGDHDHSSQSKILNMPLTLAPYQIWVG